MTVVFNVYIILISFLIFNIHQLNVYTLLSEYTFVLNFNLFLSNSWLRVGCNSFIHCKNIDWMKVWIEQCEQDGHGISWEGVASLVKATHHNGDSILQKGKLI